MLQRERESEPDLQAPGMGLPRFELFFARLLVGWRASRTSRGEAFSLFGSEMTKILKLVKSIEDSACGKRVLIPRPIGLEDSSRFWSIYMTLDHLRIVNQGISDVIVALTNGRTPTQIVRTADVKPSTTADSNVVTEFEKGCKTFQETVNRIQDLSTKLTWTHPWFGELNAERWHFLAAFHMSLHRKQIVSIQRRLTTM